MGWISEAWTCPTFRIRPSAKSSWASSRITAVTGWEDDCAVTEVSGFFGFLGLAEHVESSAYY